MPRKPPTPSHLVGFCAACADKRGFRRVGLDRAECLVCEHPARLVRVGTPRRWELETIRRTGGARNGPSTWTAW